MSPLSAATLALTVQNGTVLVHRTEGVGPPVVLVHGISSNHHFWDLQPGRSLVQHLSEAGFDVWNVDLAGHGGGSHGGSTIDDHGKQDLPAVISHVRQVRGQPVHYVGHSMGGMVLAVALATTDIGKDLARAVVVGSPLDFRDAEPMVARMLQFRALGRLVPSPAAARVLAITKRNTLGTVDLLLYNPDNLTPAAEAHMLRRVVSPLGAGEVAQFSLTRDDGEFRSAEGTLAYRDALGAVEVPMLFIAGRADRLVPPDRVWSYYEAVGSAEKRFVVAGRANGMQGDYGHLDLGVGDHAAQDVFPLISAWLQDRVRPE